MVLGRRSEGEVLDELIDGARAGRSGVVALRGEPGTGKTALLEYALESASTAVAAVTPRLPPTTGAFCSCAGSWVGSLSGTGCPTRSASSQRRQSHARRPIG